MNMFTTAESHGTLCDSHPQSFASPTTVVHVSYPWIRWNSEPYGCRRVDKVGPDQPLQFSPALSQSWSEMDEKS